MDTSNPIGIAKAFLPKVPMITKTAVFHTLGLSPLSSHWDLRTELTVNILRSFMNHSGKPQPISKLQYLTLKDPGIKGRIWISKITIPIPLEDCIRESVFGAIETLRNDQDTSNPLSYTKPETVPVGAEWTGYRAGATPQSKALNISEEQQYTELMKEVTQPTTILYFHGGAYYLLDPASHRPSTKKLAKMTGGRCLSVRYRLSPQNAFPAALLDALASFLYLLYPPPGSYHSPVSPEHIVLTGDSAGGNLSLALLQLLLHFYRTSTTIHWHGSERSIPLPGGVATNSAWCDITHSSPSVIENQKFDYLPGKFMTSPINLPADNLWPTTPPRNNLYAEDILLMHPLVSPLSAESWEGAPPMGFFVGEELLSDENRFIATKAAREGVKVRWEMYEAMPHCFAMVIEGMEGGKRCFEGWTNFIKEVVAKGKELETKGTFVKAKTLKEENVDVSSLADWDREGVLKRMRERVRIISLGMEGDEKAKL